MTNKDYDLNLWERNSAQIPAVQGESNSRTINFHLKEEVSVQDALGNLTIRQKPVDLTGCSVRLYFLKPDNTKVFTDGTVSDAPNGTAVFTLPYQATTAAGLSGGQVLITKSDGTTLKAIGIGLQTDPSDLDGALESTNDFSALVTALNKADAAAAQTEQAVANANKAINDINTKNQDMVTAENARVAAETTRENNEDTRKSDETARQTAEAARANAETARQSAEAARVTAENSRVDAESSRVSAESARVTAENKRQTDTQAAISSANNATSASNTSKAACDTATSNAENAAALANKAAGTMYASLNIDPVTGELSMSTDANYTGAEFDINSSGELEVTA